MKKTTNKGFSMVELIIVIAIMAILAAALAPALIKYINKSRLSTDITTGTSIASAAQAAMAVEAANDDSTNYTTATEVNTLLGSASSNSFASEFAEVLAVTQVSGKSKKDLNGTVISTQSYYMMVDPNTDAISVWYGTTTADYLVSPSVGTALSE
ncbi:MAG: prepilin-type N-terminal cleavage/methylation domain-containing protein [Lachnospiraceae bacterium]|nr:prepilin-type N-terminal cleavage/methylation domain-containing protein [Lachnospiraceae bacterium]